MATLKHVKAAAAKIGAMVEDDMCGSAHECRVEAPRGFTWAHGLHEFVDAAYRPWKPDYEDILERMAFGVKPCEDPECEWCHDPL